MAVHLEAKKLGLRGLSREELPRLRPLLKQAYLLLPLVLLVYLVSTSTKSIQYAAAIAIVAAIFVSLFNKGHRHTPKRLLEALAAGAVGGLMLIYPGLATDTVGLVLVGAVIFLQYMAKRRPGIASAGAK